MEVYLLYSYLSNAKEVLRVLESHYQCECAILTNPENETDVIYLKNVSPEAKRYLHQFLGGSATAVPILSENRSQLALTDTTNGNDGYKQNFVYSDYENDTISLEDLSDLGDNRHSSDDRNLSHSQQHRRAPAFLPSLSRLKPFNSHPVDQPALYCQPKRRLRPVIIDGQNVAHMYQMNVFNPMAIVYAVRYFQERGHKHITVIVPPRCGHFPVIRRLYEANLLRFVPTRYVKNEVQASDDDLLIIETAIQVDGVILSNDQYRKETAFRPEYKEFVEKRLLQFYFSGKTLIIPQDVHGAHNPSLDEILSLPVDEKVAPNPTSSIFDSSRPLNNVNKLFSISRQ